MKKILLSLSMCLLAIAANAQTAGENPAINIEEEVFYFWEEGMEAANSVTFADGAKTTITGNSEKTISSGNDITVGDKAYKSLKVSNGAQNTFNAPSGKTAVRVTFYSYINHNAEKRESNKGGSKDNTGFGYRASYWKEIAGTAYNAETAQLFSTFIDGFRQADNSVTLDDTALSNPDALTFDLNAVSEFTYTNTGEQVCYVMKVAYGTISGGSTEPQTPIITLTAEVDGAARNFEFGSGVADNKISIDWGDGNIVEATTIANVFDGWTTTQVTDTLVGAGEIKIYATGAVTYFDCVSKVDGPGITKLDVSNAAELKELYANGNKLTTFDGSKLTKLTRLELHNNSLTEVNLPSSLTTLKLDNNQLTSFDGSNCTLVTTLYLSNNNLGTLDVSMMPALKSLYALNCGLTSVNAPLKVAKAYISVNNNKLETLDVTEATGLENGSLFATGNNLTEVKLPNVKVKSVNISKNKFTLATIPATANVTTLTYAPQQDMEIADIDGTIDLSAQNNLTGFATEAKPTVYTWYAEDGTALVAGTDYTEDAGKFTFVKEQAQKVYCTMTTEALPKFTGASIFKTIAVAVKATATGIENIESDAAMTGDIYSVDGKLIKRGANLTDMQKGLYIIKTAAGKTVKVSK